MVRFLIIKLVNFSIPFTLFIYLWYNSLIFLLKGTFKTMYFIFISGTYNIPNQNLQYYYY